MMGDSSNMCSIYNMLIDLHQYDNDDKRYSIDTDLIIPPEYKGNNKYMASCNLNNEIDTNEIYYSYWNVALIILVLLILF